MPEHSKLIRLNVVYNLPMLTAEVTQNYATPIYTPLVHTRTHTQFNRGGEILNPPKTHPPYKRVTRGAAGLSATAAGCGLINYYNRYRSRNTQMQLTPVPKATDRTEWIATAHVPARQLMAESSAALLCPCSLEQ